MKMYIQDIRELSDSKEMLDAKPHFFLTWFIYILIAIILITVIWSYFGEIEEYITASGIVRPSDKVSTIRNLVTSKVKKNYLEEGMKVNKGDILYTVDIENIVLERDEKTKLLLKLEQDNLKLSKLKLSVNKGVNLFNKSDKEESDYYILYQKYSNDIKLNEEQVIKSNSELEYLLKEAKLDKELLENNILNYYVDIDNLNLLLKSVEQNSNLFDKSDIENFNKFESYKYSIGKMELDVQSKITKFNRSKKLFDVGGLSQRELEDAKYQMDNSLLEYDLYRNELNLKINEEIRQYQQSITEIKNNLEKDDLKIKNYNLQIQNQIGLQDKIHLDTLVQIQDNINSNTINIDKIRNDISLLQLSIDESIVIAPIEGYVNLLNNITEGDFIQSGMEIASIVPSIEGDFKIQLKVFNKDISGLKVGQKIKYHFHALPFQEYGEIEGEIKKIANDAKFDMLTGMSYYIVEASIEEYEINSNEDIQLKIGMTCDARVIKKSKKILFWFLEKINLID